MPRHLRVYRRLDLQDPLGRHMARRTHSLHGLGLAANKPRQRRLTANYIRCALSGILFHGYTSIPEQQPEATKSNQILQLKIAMIVTTIGCMVGAMKTIGSRIAAARIRKGINQSALSRLVGVKPQSVQAWEADKNTPRPKRLSLIAAALDVSVSDLVDGSSVDAESLSRTSLAKQAKDARRTSHLKDGEILIQKYELPDMVQEEMPTYSAGLVSDITVGIRQLDGLGLKYSAPTNLSIITAWDQSMENTIHDKDFVLIDHGIQQYAGDGIYLITWAGHLFIRRLQLAGTDKLELVADSPAQKDRVVPAGKVVVHAKALLVWKAGKL